MHKVGRQKVERLRNVGRKRAQMKRWGAQKQCWTEMVVRERRLNGCKVWRED